MLPQWTQNFIDVNGAMMHYTLAAQTGKPPLVLVHGFSDNGLCWQPLARELEDCFDVMMPDARGHGLSQRVRRGEQTDMTADLAGVIVCLGLDRPVVGGHSMGGVIAAELGARYPALVRALILEDPAWFLPERGQTRTSIIRDEDPFKTWIEVAQRQTAEQVMAQCRVDHPTWPEIVVQAWCAGKQQLDVNFFSTQDASWNRWQEAVRSIRCPTLLITADPELGGIIISEVASWVTATNPCFRVAHIAGAGHHVRFEQEAAYTAAVKGFLKEIS